MSWFNNRDSALAEQSGPTVSARAQRPPMPWFAVGMLAVLALVAGIGAVATGGAGGQRSEAVGGIQLVAACDGSTTFVSQSESGWFNTAPALNAKRKIKFRSRGGKIVCENGKQVFYGYASEYKERHCITDSKAGTGCTETNWIAYTKQICNEIKNDLGRNQYTGCDPYQKIYVRWGSLG